MFKDLLVGLFMILLTPILFLCLCVLGIMSWIIGGLVFIFDCIYKTKHHLQFPTWSKK